MQVDSVPINIGFQQTLDSSVSDLSLDFRTSEFLQEMMKLKLNTNEEKTDMKSTCRSIITLAILRRKDMLRLFLVGIEDILAGNNISQKLIDIFSIEE